MNRVGGKRFFPARRIHFEGGLIFFYLCVGRVDMGARGERRVGKEGAGGGGMEFLMRGPGEGVVGKEFCQFSVCLGFQGLGKSSKSRQLLRHPLSLKCITVRCFSHGYDMPPFCGVRKYIYIQVHLLGKKQLGQRKISTHSCWPWRGVCILGFSGQKTGRGGFYLFYSIPWVLCWLTSLNVNCVVGFVVSSACCC